MPRRRLIPVLLAIAAIALLVAAAISAGSAVNAGASDGVTILHLAKPVTHRGPSFLSVYPECGCARRTVIEQFSLRTGRPVRALARLTVGSGAQISQAASDGSGNLWLTATTGPRNRSEVAGGDPQPNSCTGRLLRFDPWTGATRTVMTFPRDQIAGNAVPSPDGQRVAVLVGGCSTAFFNEHIEVVDLRTGHAIQIGSRSTPCHWLFNVSWSADGSRLIFPYGRSVLSAHTHYVPSGTCEQPRPSGLAVASATRPSQPASWQQWKPARGCTYESAAFDAPGVVASEACAHGATAALVQLSAAGSVQRTLPLRPRYDEGAVVADPADRQVLVSETESGNPRVRWAGWVWTYASGSLRVVGRYPQRDATLVIAQPL